MSPLQASRKAATYDAWGRLVRSNGNGSTSSVTGPIRQTVYRYDALGRRIDSRDYVPSADPATATPAAITQSFYDGSNLIEERDGSGTVRTQYVWSAAGPNQLILRDRDADGNAATSDSHIPQVSGVGLDERLYAQSDASGSVTSTADVNGNVPERYLFDQDGRPRLIVRTGATGPIRARGRRASPTT